MFVSKEELIAVLVRGFTVNYDGEDVLKMDITERCYWVEPDRLLAGPCPGDGSFFDVEWSVLLLLDAGIRVFVNLKEEEYDIIDDGECYEPYDWVVERLGRVHDLDVTCYRFPIRDFRTPSVEEMWRILTTIDSNIASGRPVYVHCHSGKGRTGMVVGCYLVWKGLATRENFVRVIGELRQNAGLTGQSPETPAQEKFVRSFPYKEM